MKREYSLVVLPLLLLPLYIFVSCEESSLENQFHYPPKNEDEVTISQGVWGNVWFWEGNFMPVIDPTQAKITPVIRDISIYEATTNSMVESFGGIFFTKINSTLITTIQSDEGGFFEVSLAPGKYSFFVKEDTLFYANEWDGKGYILSATVTENKITERQIDITYKAVF